MESVWESPEELHQCFLYWQKRALNAEREVEEDWDYIEEILDAYKELDDKYIDLKREYKRLENIVEDSFSDYTKSILKEERRRGMIEVDGNR
jgi:hypothetical protein